MIVLDENIYDPQLATRINAWYRGQVISINSLRPSTLVKDDSIPTLLLQVSQPTFVTINIEYYSLNRQVIHSPW